MPKKTVERRYHPRTTTATDVLIANGDRWLKGKVRDVSAGGAMIEWLDLLETIDQALKIGQFIDIDAGGDAVLAAVVVRTDDRTLGVRFQIPESEWKIRVRDIHRIAGRSNLVA